MGQKKTLKLGDKEAKRIVSRGRGRAGHGGAAAPSMSTWNPGNHTGTGAQVLCRAVHLILALGKSWESMLQPRSYRSAGTASQAALAPSGQNKLVPRRHLACGRSFALTFSLQSGWAQGFVGTYPERPQLPPAEVSAGLTVM